MLYALRKEPFDYRLRTREDGKHWPSSAPTHPAKMKSNSILYSLMTFYSPKLSFLSHHALAGGLLLSAPESPHFMSPLVRLIQKNLSSLLP